MAIRDTRTVRLKNSFIADCLDKIIKEEEENGREDTSYAIASGILRKRILSVGWKK